MTPEYIPDDFPEANGWRDLAAGIADGRGLEALQEFMERHGTPDTSYRVYVPSGHEVERRAKQGAASWWVSSTNTCPTATPGLSRRIAIDHLGREDLKHDGI